MGKYPKPDTWTGSASEDDLVVMLQGSGGRVSDTPYQPSSYHTTDERRNDQKDAFG